MMIIVYININGDATIDISECIFDNNKADVEGGVFLIVPLGAFHISNSLFIKNQAGSDGGVLVMNTYFEMEGADHQWVII